MDKIANYKTIVRQLVSEIGDEGSSSYPEIETLKLLDDGHGQYALMNSGWRGERRTYGNFLHVEVKPDGKVWLEHDGTDLEVANMLVERGIPKSDLVLGFQAPVRRQYSGFAVA